LITIVFFSSMTMVTICGSQVQIQETGITTECRKSSRDHY